MLSSPYANYHLEYVQKWLIDEALLFFSHCFSICKRFVAFVRMVKPNSVAAHRKSVPLVDKGSPDIPSKLSVISVSEDSDRQFVLVKVIGSNIKFNVVAPSHEFDVNMSADDGKIVHVWACSPLFFLVKFLEPFFVETLAETKPLKSLKYNLSHASLILIISDS